MLRTRRSCDALTARRRFSTSTRLIGAGSLYRYNLAKADFEKLAERLEKGARQVRAVTERRSRSAKALFDRFHIQGSGTPLHLPKACRTPLPRSADHEFQAVGQVNRSRPLVGLRFPGARRKLDSWVFLVAPGRSIPCRARPVVTVLVAPPPQFNQDDSPPRTTHCSYLEPPSRTGTRSTDEGGSLDLGFRVSDEEITRRHVTLRITRRAMHMACLARPGAARVLPASHRRAGHRGRIEGSSYFDLHGDATPFLMRTINARERRVRRHLSDKLILIEPADPIVSVGLNPLEAGITGLCPHRGSSRRF